MIEVEVVVEEGAEEFQPSQASEEYSDLTEKMKSDEVNRLIIVFMKENYGEMDKKKKKDSLYQKAADTINRTLNINTLNREMVRNRWRRQMEKMKDFKTNMKRTGRGAKPIPKFWEEMSFLQERPLLHSKFTLQTLKRKVEEGQS